MKGDAKMPLYWLIPLPLLSSDPSASFLLALLLPNHLISQPLDKHCNLHVGFADRTKDCRGKTSRGLGGKAQCGPSGHPGSLTSYPPGPSSQLPKVLIPLPAPDLNYPIVSWDSDPKPPAPPVFPTVLSSSIT